MLKIWYIENKTNAMIAEKINTYKILAIHFVNYFRNITYNIAQFRFFFINSNLNNVEWKL